MNVQQGSAIATRASASSPVESLQREDDSVPILVVMRHKAVRQALALALAEEGLTVSGEADSLGGAHLYFSETGVVVVDLSLQDGSGLDLIETVGSQNPRMRILALVAGAHEAVEATGAGASAILDKSVGLTVFVDTVRCLTTKDWKPDALWADARPGTWAKQDDSIA